jgi:hypothetical protein
MQHITTCFPEPMNPIIPLLATAARRGRPLLVPPEVEQRLIDHVLESQKNLTARTAENAALLSAISRQRPYKPCSSIGSGDADSFSELLSWQFTNVTHAKWDARQRRKNTATIY